MEIRGTVTLTVSTSWKTTLELYWGGWGAKERSYRKQSARSKFWKPVISCCKPLLQIWRLQNLREYKGRVKTTKIIGYKYLNKK